MYYIDREASLFRVPFSDSFTVVISPPQLDQVLMQFSSSYKLYSICDSKVWQRAQNELDEYTLSLWSHMLAPVGQTQKPKL